MPHRITSPTSQKRIRDDFAGNRSAYAAHLIHLLRHHQPWVEKSVAWRTCKPGPHPLVCPVEWAAEVHQGNCHVVWTDYDPHADLSGPYYVRVLPYAEESLMSGVIRLAHVLNGIAAAGAATTGMETRVPVGFRFRLRVQRPAYPPRLRRRRRS
jgi:hypothetical protein